MDIKNIITGLALSLLLGNGVAVAAADSAEISARIKMANMLMDGIPETQLTAMLADGERGQNNEEWLSLVVGTLELCMKNLETQQNLINVWREMYASGAFE
jgi:hypothetical protein